jgi:hypothetical protein
MGTSATAILFYGYLWDDDESTCRVASSIHGVGLNAYDPGEHSISGWEELIHERRGGTNPWRACPDDERKIAAWKPANREAIDAYFAAKKAITEEFGVDLGYHGAPAHDVDAPHLAIAGSDERVGGLDGLAVTPEMLAVGPDWKARLDRWLAEFGIEPPQAEPQWWVVAEYG